MDRRMFFEACIATPFVAVVPAQAATDPLPGLFKEWKHLRDRFNAEYPEEGDALYERFYETEDRIFLTQATSPEGVIAQIEFAIEEEIDLTLSFDGHRALFDNIKAALKAMG